MRTACEQHRATAYVGACGPDSAAAIQSAEEVGRREGLDASHRCACAAVCLLDRVPVRRRLLDSIIPVLGASAFVIAALHVMGYTLLSRANDTAVEVARLYKELGYRDKTLSFDNWTSPIVSSSSLFTMLHRGRHGRHSENLRGIVAAYEMALLLVSLILLVLLPAAAETATLIRVGSLLSWGGYLLWTILILPILISIVGTVWMVIRDGVE